MAKYLQNPTVVEATQWWKNGDHPEDRVGETVQGPMGGSDYERLEGVVVRYFRHPDIPGEDRDVDGCGRTWHDHGWIDSVYGGYPVCPGDWIITGTDGERHPCKPNIFENNYKAAE